MAIKSILVLVDATDAGKWRFICANRLAEEFCAHLEGFFCQTVRAESTATLPRNAAAAIATTSVRTQKYGDKWLDVFTDNHGEGVFRWDEKSFMGSLRRLSRVHDLVVVGNDTLPSSDCLTALISPAAKIATEAACPVLVVGEQCTFSPPFKHPLIAWNGDRQVARAVKDALPFLIRAEAVAVFSAFPQHATSSADEAQALMNFLAMHGVRTYCVEGAEVKPMIEMSMGQPWSGDALSDVIVRRVVSHRHDLVVMGAHGHSRVAELLTGTVLRGVIEHVRVPIFLAY